MKEKKAVKKTNILAVSLAFSVLAIGLALFCLPPASFASVTLTILSRTNDSVTVAWPSNSTTSGFVLQTNGNLGPANWNFYGGTVSNAAGSNIVTVSPLTSTEFFRLMTNGAPTGPKSIPGMAYYWSYKDLPANSQVNAWTDEIQQAVMSYNNGGAGNGVFPQTTSLFPGLNIPSSGEAIAFTNSLTPFGSNFTFWVVMRPSIETDSTNEVIIEDPSVHGINISTNTLSANWGHNIIKYSSMKLNYTNTVAFPYGETYDILDSGGTLYSNGVAMTSGLGQPANNFPFSAIGAAVLGNGTSMEGYIQYMGIWTNHLLTAADAQNLDNWYWNYGITNVTNGLIAWWKLNDGLGTKAADSWGTNTMYFGGTGNTWTNNAMVNGGALYFTGSGWLTNVSKSFADNLPGMTVSCWVNESGLGGNGPDGAFIQKGVLAGDGSPASPGFVLGADGLSNVAFGCYNSINGNYSESPHNAASPKWPIVGDNNWHFLVGEYTNTPVAGMTPVLYIDGAQITGLQEGANGPVTNITALTGPIFIGAENFGNGTGMGTPSGIVNDIRIYNRMLSTEEIQDLYKWRGPP